MQENIKEQIIKYKTNILRARFNLLFMVILSVVNVMSVYFSHNAIMPFSSAISTYSTYFGVLISKEQGSEGIFMFIGLLIAAIILGALLLCYYKSKNNPLFFIIAMVIIIIDTIVLLAVFAINAFASTLLFVDLIIHIMTIFYLRSALKSHKQLGVIDTLSYESILSNVDEEPLEDDDNSSVNLEISTPVCKYIDEGDEPIVCGEYEELDVFVVIRNKNAELVINGYVCDAIELTHNDEYELCAIVNNIEFNFQYKRNYGGEAMYLYAENELIDSLIIDF
ncbi:MAG: hypothetical protein E7586_05465 [Ruminococcaceae bacterium]|nr:hypothetical protein [Oscillospiraceae bacterium]